MDFRDMGDLISMTCATRMPTHHSITGGRDADPCESSQNRRTLEMVLPTISEVLDLSLNRKTLLLPFRTNNPWEPGPKSIQSDPDTSTVYARPTTHWQRSTLLKIEALSTPQDHRKAACAKLWTSMPLLWNSLSAPYLISLILSTMPLSSY